MNGLVEKLRKMARSRSSRPSETAEWIAADRITALEAENARLREALQSIADWPDRALTAPACARDMRTTARTALTEEPRP